MNSVIYEDRDVRTYKLSQKILCVAVEGTVGDWSAYIGTIERSSDEWRKIAYNGTKLEKKIAYLLFPEFAKKYKWRA